ncbi:MAG: hypothetical protein R3B72_52500, partial [Polyangiaceae bacterium]
LLAFGAPKDAAYAFSIRAAHLPDAEVIQAYFAYRGVNIDLSPYKLGTVIRHPQGVDIDNDHPVLVEIASPDVPFSDTPRAEVFFLPQDATDDSTSYVRSAYMHYNQHFVSLWGRLGAGDTVILLRDGPPGQPVYSSTLSYTLPDMAIPSDGGGGKSEVNSDTALMFQQAADCNPVPPACSFPSSGCTGTAPSCGPGNILCPATLDSNSCSTSITERGSKKCMSPGEVWSKQKQKAKQHKFTIALKDEGGGGEYSYTHAGTSSETGGFTCPDGANGVGRCYQYFECAQHCLSKWTKLKDRWVPIYVLEEYVDKHGVGHLVPIQSGQRREVCVVPTTVTSACTSQYQSSAFCERTIQ